MFKQAIAVPAEPKATEFKRRTWCDRTLVKTHAICVVLGIALTLWFGSQMEVASAATKPTAPVMALAAAHDTTSTTVATSGK